MSSFENELVWHRRGAGSRRAAATCAPPKVEKIKPRSGLSRAEVIADQRRRILDGLAVALAYHGYEDTKITDIVELAASPAPPSTSTSRARSTALPPLMTTGWSGSPPRSRPRSGRARLGRAPLGRAARRARLPRRRPAAGPPAPGRVARRRPPRPARARAHAGPPGQALRRRPPSSPAARRSPRRPRACSPAASPPTSRAACSPAKPSACPSRTTCCSSTCSRPAPAASRAAGERRADRG